MMRLGADLSSSPSLSFFPCRMGVLGGLLGLFRISRVFTFTTKQKRTGLGLAVLHQVRGDWLLVPPLLLWLLLPHFIPLPLILPIFLHSP